MKPKIRRYGTENRNFIAIRKNGLVTDIACSEKNSGMFSTYFQPNPKLDPFSKKNGWGKFNWEIQPKDLALYTHWPRHTQEFWDLLNET